MLPHDWGPHHHPLPLPLVISPHGRKNTAWNNAARYWQNLPAAGPFALVCPDGLARAHSAESDPLDSPPDPSLFTYGNEGHIDDLARMPRIVQETLPWLPIDPRRVFVLGSSMGGQETLLLVALHPRLLTGAAALDSATDMAARYRAFALIAGGVSVQQLARIEIGGTPQTVPAAYAARSPITYVRQLAFSGVPLHIWWSTRDRIVLDQNQESGRLYRAVKRANPRAPVTQYVGIWAHSKEMYPLTRLPLALLRLKLIKLDEPLPAIGP